MLTLSPLYGKVEDVQLTARSRTHVEVPVKVNAWVDEGIAELVEALNDLPAVMTTNSCEGSGEFSHVNFSYRGSLSQFSNFMRTLSIGLSAPLTDGGYRLKIEWVAGGERPLGALIARREVVQSLAKAIRQLAVSFDRKSPSQRGSRDRGLRS
jgi:hypothetical protein